jgi:hypothetical protein
MYERGEGVPIDYAKAMEWYLKAANQNDPQAVLGQIIVGQLYEKGGPGVGQDYAQAYKWFDIAANHKSYDVNSGCPIPKTSPLDLACSAALQREALASKMTQTQIDEARDLSRESKTLPETGARVATDRQLTEEEKAVHQDAVEKERAAEAARVKVEHDRAIASARAARPKYDQQAIENEVCHGTRTPSMTTCLEFANRLTGCPSYSSIALEAFDFAHHGVPEEIAMQTITRNAYGPQWQAFRGSVQVEQLLAGLVTAAYRGNDVYGDTSSEFARYAFESCMRGEPF